MSYQVKNFNHLLGTAGFSDALLKNHFALYKGYVDNTNKYVEEFTALLKKGEIDTPAYAEMKRRFTWEFNGMKLHELYFGGMIKDGEKLHKDSPLAEQMKKDFGSVAAWQKAFRAMGAMRGVGWVLLCFDPDEPSLYNVWINEHNVNWPAGTSPVMIMDVWEHAFMLDYGVKRDGYLDAFMEAVDWRAAEDRFQAAHQKVLVSA